MIADDLVAALLQPARDLDGLVRADPAGNAERNQRPCDAPVRSAFRTFSSQQLLCLQLQQCTSYNLLARAPALIAELDSWLRRAQSSRRKCCDDPLGRARAHEDAPARPGRWRASCRRSFEFVVDDDVVVFGERGDFVARRLEPALHRRFGISAPAAQPLLEHLVGRRQDENADRRLRAASAPAARPGRRSRARGHGPAARSRSVSSAPVP